MMTPELQIYNTLTKQKEKFAPIVPGKISLYVCGVTVYDYCHVGHARVFVGFDMVVRFLRAMGWDVNYVRNITDIDDKIIKRAAENKEEIDQITARFIQAMDEDSQRLGVLKPDAEPRATQYIENMVAMIKRLVDEGVAYVADTSNGGNNSKDVYFSVDKFPAYGELAHKDLEKLQSGARVEIEVNKKNPLDFVLWKQSKPGEPSWESPWGPGRPGWHIECSAMATTCLGNTIDIHGGGADLKFPHHENERAQAEGATHQRFVNTWMHVGFVQTDKEKMSKSLNNFFTIRDVLANYDGEAIRYFLLASHYRSPVNYSQEQLELAKNALTTLYTALRGLKIAELSDAELASNAYTQDGHLKKFIQAMSDDFNTPEAFVVLFDLARDLNVAKSEKSDNIDYLAGLLKKLGNILGLLEKDPELFLQGGTGDALSAEIDKLIAERIAARESKNWARADELRKMLDNKNIIIEDTPEGTLWRQK